MPKYVQRLIYYSISVLILLAVLSDRESSVSAGPVYSDGKNIEEPSGEEKEILNGADKRIEKYRMATATLKLVSKEGKPIPGARVLVEQTNHEFLFGANHSIRLWAAVAQNILKTQPDKWASAQKAKTTKYQLDVLDDRFFEFANYTSLPVAWPFYEKNKGVINNTVYDEMIDILHAKGFKVLAHNLVWNSNTPAWVPNDCDQIGRAVEKRVADFMLHYKGKFDYYLIFNEPANPFRPHFKKDKMTKCFAEFGKVRFVSMPFKIAREINPEAKLMINEVSILEHQGFPELLKNLNDTNGKPYYDTIGIQMHMRSSLWPLDGIWKLCEYYSRFTAPIQITELTVLSGTPMSGKSYGKVSTAEGERLQAEYVVNLYTVLFSHPSIEAIQWWNLSDLMAWEDAPAGLLRSDMTPKPAYTALLNLIKKKWWTRVEAKTGDEGQCQFKGFYGTYKISVTLPNGTMKTFEIDLSKKGQRDFRLVD